MTRKSRALHAYVQHHRHLPTGLIYGHRNKIIKSLGFTSYQDYLQSGLWKSIRIRVLDKNNGRCIRCGRKAIQAHHARYDRATLDGTCLTNLYPVCYGCHRRAEVNEKGKKRSLYEANAFLGAITQEELDKHHKDLFTPPKVSRGSKRKAFYRRRNKHA